MINTKNILFSLILVIFLSNSCFSQNSDNIYGIGGSFGFIEKIHFYSKSSKQIQLSVELGDLIYNESTFQIGIIGATFKYFLNNTDLSPYLGFSVAHISTNDDYLYFSIPIGLQKNTNENLAVFAGLNPGLFYPIEGENSFVLGVEVGAAIYF